MISNLISSDLLSFLFPLSLNPQPASEDECTGMQELARAVGGAWERAKKRGVEDKLYKKMNGRMKSATLNLVRCLIDEDDAFQPGDWYTNSKFAKVKSVASFDRKVEEVRKKVDGWEWESCRS